MIFCFAGSSTDLTAYAKKLKQALKLPGDCPILPPPLDFLQNLESLDDRAFGAALQNYLEALPEPLILLGREMGNGLVPLSPEARRFRERNGLFLQAAAARAERVDYVLAGLGICLKYENKG